ncbi:MAG TPA: RNA-directed DNA polymerase [Thiotrichaceae bacterium]|nr:RNA-directed DNA polymerase [Thiotrichaceae bacterium]
MKTILKLTEEEAKAFFIKPESYCNIHLPIYIKFENVIGKVVEELKEKRLSDFYGSSFDQNKEKNIPTKPYNYEGVNYTLINNKDGKYAWRPLQLIHPALYVDLVNRITLNKNWEVITKRFNDFSTHKAISCLSLPVQSETEQSDKATIIQNWWQKIEQKSIELGLDYAYLLQTDITDCYGSLYTHSIAWALHDKNYAKANQKDKNLIGNVIDECIRNMTYGQTNGIPQGSVLMDFIAEMVLGYADLQLGYKIEELEITDYRILRYRDDYRIFTHNQQDAELIVKQLTGILIDLGMKINPHKTGISSNVIRDSLKPDKYYWINHRKSSKNLQKYLFNIHMLSERYPNSASLKTELSKFFDRIQEQKEDKDNIIVMISIVTDIMLKNPGVYPLAAAILSELLDFFNDDEKKIEIINRIIKRFEQIANTAYLEVWLQRITLKLKRDFPYKEKLCDKVTNSTSLLWNSEWLNDRLKKLIDSESIVDGNEIELLNPVINRTEVQWFYSSY